MSEENSGLHVQNQKLSEEASYAKELASAAAVELKNLAGEVTKLSLQNAKLEKELVAAQDQANARNGGWRDLISDRNCSLDSPWWKDLKVIFKQQQSNTICKNSFI